MNKRHYEHTLPNIRGSLSNTYLIPILHKFFIKLYPFPSHEPTTGIHSDNPSNLFPYFTVPDYKPRLYYS